MNHEKGRLFDTLKLYVWKGFSAQAITEFINITFHGITLRRP